jgi:outer membrane protein
MNTCRTTTSRLLVPAILCAWAASASAETLDEAWNIALSADQRLQASRERVRSAECTHAAATANYWPSVSNLTGYTFLSDAPTVNFSLPAPVPISGGFPILDDKFVANSTIVKMPVYTGGRITRAVDAASSQISAARNEEVRTSLDIKLEVGTAYVTVLRAQRAVEVVRANVESLDAHVKDVRSLLAQGMVAKNALLAAEVALADARQRTLQATNGLDAARAAYNRLLGRPLTDPVALEDIEVSPPEGDLESLTSQAVGTRPELRQLSSHANALRCQAASVRAEKMPQAGVIGGFTFLENRQIDPEGIWSLTFGVEWKPFDAGMTSAKTNALLHDASAVSRLRADATTAIALQVRRAWLDQRETRERIDVTSKALEQADENLRMARARFTNGEANYTEVLDAETLRTTSFNNYYGAVYDAVLATLRLHRAVGSL